MEYKGYMASISYDEASDLLHGSVVNSGSYPVVTFMAPDVAGLKREFKISVDEYLAACEAEGAEPIKPFSGDISIDLGPKLHYTITLLAMEDGMTPKEWIKRVLEEKVWQMGNPGE